MKWNSILYDKNHDFVAEYGKELLQYVPNDKNQVILDLGCGTGTLTIQLAALAEQVVGIDSSEYMIMKARSQFQGIDFLVCDALKLPFNNAFDVVFSNAVFHWISDHEALLENIHKALKVNGMLICEFGAEGNIAIIENAFRQSCEQLGYDYKSTFNFSSDDTFRQRLKQKGFDVELIDVYDRPTILKDGRFGLTNWLKQFYASKLERLSMKQQERLLQMMEERTKDTLWNGKEWILDYKRLRAVALKKP